MDGSQNLKAGIEAYQARDYAAAERAAQAALNANPSNFRAANLLGMSIYRQGRIDESISHVIAAIRLCPEYAAGHSNLGALYKENQQYDLALQHLDLAIRYAPEEADFHQNRAAVLFELRRYGEATDAYEHAISLNPASPEAHTGLGVVFVEMGRLQDAIRCHDNAIALNPAYAVAYNNRGVALCETRRFDDAVADYNRAIQLDSAYVEAFSNRGVALKELRKYGQALADYRQAIALKPDYADAHNNIGNLLSILRDYAGARESYKRCWAIEADYPLALGNVLKCSLHLCDWSDLTALIEQVERAVDLGNKVIDPFTFLAISENPLLQQRCAQMWAKPQVESISTVAGDSPANRRLRIAYLSADFHQHATAYLMAQVFELHDRSQFETTAISFGPDDNSPMRARLRQAFDHFHDVSRMGDSQVADLMGEMGIDIAIDLKGYTEHARAGILARRPAPIQVNYLGYPGTMGAPYVDYVVVDRIVVPEADQRYYDEKLVYLPDCYQPNDANRSIGERTPTRRECGLPERGFVFCCFNNNYKILPGVFDVWARLLREVDGSVLWLLKDSEATARNLVREAKGRGVGAERLVFAERVELPEHLARHRLADLFLDTRPYNAHTTASDALWAGLPVLTCEGRTFSGRVAASVLTAADLSELIAPDMVQYEALAVKLARDQEILANIRDKLVASRDTCALFDCVRHTRHLERAYRMMWERKVRGERAETLRVPPIR